MWTSGSLKGSHLLILPILLSPSHPVCTGSKVGWLPVIPAFYYCPLCTYPCLTFGTLILPWTFVATWPMCLILTKWTDLKRSSASLKKKKCRKYVLCAICCPKCWGCESRHSLDSSPLVGNWPVQHSGQDYVPVLRVKWAHLRVQKEVTKQKK